MSLQVNYQGKEFIVEEGSTALIGSGERSTIQIPRPGISRQHAAVAYDGAVWKVEDAGSRNGTFENGERVQITTIDGPKTLVLGHPTEGEVVQFREVAGQPAADLQAEIDAFVLPETAPPAAPPAAPAAAAATKVQRTTPARNRSKGASMPTDPNELTAAIRDQIAAIKGLTWSVWAMIAVTAALCVLTLFVGILGS